ncbi:zf-C3HC4 type zinc finger [Coprinopsis cinerea okayama7|uniref:Zf-C3HC4 type zinc finger n=1 Tax=Coprinopsis cinerea (strain Okayama-7 / 130 / ATCC MYA-4618 / FGSC 9003) TaxID=240176 RepID=A8NHF6_COPC7|nr:zf-C3HC4 type zinc finger [Coprinopsis cinerea okayama7\|eukprot:XP_001833749.1 zf-C3HC4 type zinc finger [Coprinopsis cinerea okayama7\
MGNSSSSSGRHQEDTVDYGALVPPGVYTGPRDWNQAIVSQLIAARKLAPFYRPLEEYDESWDDDQILAARKEFRDSSGDQPDSQSRSDHGSFSSSHHSSKSSHSKRPNGGKEFRPEVAVYRGAIECPICFLYYPPNINHSRCCDQAICTECFVQIKRAEPTTTHLVSEPAACPYCVQENFGIVYNPPPWRAGIGSEGASPITPADVNRRIEQSAIPYHKKRQKSYSADSPEVVTIDQIRPDWEAKLAAVRAAVARRANRRIIMRQVGDRLIPVGIGRVQTPEEAAEGGNSGSRRRRHHPANGELGTIVGMGGQDLEELMLMEAMRLSLIEHEEHQRREAEERKKKEAAERAAAAENGEGEPSDAQGAPSSSQAAPSSSSAAPPPSSSSNDPSGSLAPSGQHSRSPTPDSNNRTPPPFSTMNAALLTSGTATAFLNASSDPSSGSTTPSVPIPAVTLTGDAVPTTGPSPEAPSASSVSSSSVLTGDLPRPASLSSSTTPSSGSSLGPDPSLAGHAVYGTLPSSPESIGQSPPLEASSKSSNDRGNASLPSDSSPTDDGTAPR